jgi:hypothetical protein
MFIKIDSIIFNPDKLNFIKFDEEEGVAIAILYFENGESILLYGDKVDELINCFEERLCNGKN